MTIVVDASVALKWVLHEEGSEAAERLLDEELIAPSLWLVEAGNALWRRSTRGEISAAEAQERLSELFNAPVTTVALEEDVIAAVRLAAELDHPVYDCLYLALAIREGTYVVTADRRFGNALSKHPTLSGTVRLLEQVA
ncbi:MAG: type II toxin-antitoxin system VapC family toxin [Pirellulaceae bacterium]